LEGIKKMFPDLQAKKPVELLQGTETTAELGCWPQCPVWKNVRPTREDICNSVVMNVEFKY
jgi:hypothetical protein